MSHPAPRVLIEFGAGVLPADELRVVAAHVAACDTCRRLAAEYADVHAMLGEWTVAVPEAPVLPVRLAAAAGVTRWPRLTALTRAAAAILLGVGAGYSTAQLWRPQPAPQAPQTVNVDVLGLEWLGAPSATGLDQLLADSTSTEDVP